jgi:gamma-glutamyltranspeptidase
LRYAIGLRPYGQLATFDEMTSGLHIIVRRRDGRLAAGVDPRREGAAMGD